MLSIVIVNFNLEKKTICKMVLNISDNVDTVLNLFLTMFMVLEI